MKRIFKTQAFLLCLALLGFTHSAFAANILIASTTEVNAGVTGQFIPNLYTQFTLGGHTVTAAPDSLGTAATNAQPNFAGYDLVVIMGVYDGLTAANETAVTAAINGKTSEAFALFLDGTSGDGTVTIGVNSHNADTLVRILNANNNGFTSVAGVYTSNGLEDFPLNGASPFAASFAGINPFQAGAYVPFNAASVPANNTLYTDANNDAFGVFVPQSQSNAGAGACLFAVSDASQFADVYQAANPNFGATILAASTAVGGCLSAAAVPTTAVPTLSEWMLMVLALLLLVVGIRMKKGHTVTS